MNDKYLVVIRNERSFFAENYWLVWGDYGYKDLADHRIFTWTVVPSLNDSRRLSFNRVFFICKICAANCEVYIYEVLKSFQNSKLRIEMDLFAASIRKRRFWRPNPALSYAKLDRRIKLPFDEWV